MLACKLFSLVISACKAFGVFRYSGDRILNSRHMTIRSLSLPSSGKLIAPVQVEGRVGCHVKNVNGKFSLRVDSVHISRDLTSIAVQLNRQRLIKIDIEK